MKEASEKYSREMQSRSRPGSRTQSTECDDDDKLTPLLANYLSSRTVTGRDKDIGQFSEREQQPRRRREYDSDDSMDDAPPTNRGYDREYDRDYDRREPDTRERRDRHGGRDRGDVQYPRQIPDPRYQDPRLQEPRLQDPRLQDPRLQDPRLQDPRLQDPRLQDPRYQDPRLQDPRLQDPRSQEPRYQDPRYQDPRDMPVTNRHQAYTSAYSDAPVAAYALASQAPGYYDQQANQPRTTYGSNNTPPPATRGGQYGQPGYVPVSQPGQVIRDPTTGRPILIPAGYVEPSRHNRR